MRINSITVQNFLGLPSYQKDLAQPVLFIAGPNGSGKSSLLEAVRFALTGAPPRGVSTARDRVDVITEGAASGFAQVDLDGASVRRAIASGKVAGDQPELPPNLDLCLDAARFAKMPDVDRRKLLFGLAGVKMDRETVHEQLRIAEVPDFVIEQVLPKLSGGFPAAATFARDQAKEARGAWKATTGEAYGSKKAEDWTASTDGDTPSEQEIKDTQKAIALHEQQAAELQEAVGRVKGAVSDEKREQYQELADGIGDAEREVEKAQAAYDDASAEVTRLEASSKGHVGRVQPCPSCGTRLLVGAELTEAGDEPPETTPAEVNAAKASTHDAYNELKRCRRALNEHQSAQKVLDNLPPPPSDEDLQAGELLEEERKKITFHRESLTWLQNKKREHAQAAELTKKAAGYHRETAAWSAAETALGPDGIPAILLSRALDPINLALAQYAEAAGWHPPAIERDLTLSYGGRGYALVSESEQWRADTLFALAIAVLSDARVLLLDRFDVLEPAARGEALDFLCDIAQEAVGTVIVAGTLKAKPDLGDDIGVSWLGDA